MSQIYIYLFKRLLLINVMLNTFYSQKFISINCIIMQWLNCVTRKVGTFFRALKRRLFVMLTMFESQLTSQIFSLASGLAFAEFLNQSHPQALATRVFYTKEKL